MWRIIRAEASYHKWLFLGFLAAMPGLIIHEMIGPVERVHPAFLIWILIFMPINFWVSFRAKDKRELQYTQLPVKVREIGAARILMVLGSALVSTALYTVLHVIVTPSAPLHIKAFLVSILSVVFLYSLVFIIMDRVMGHPRLGDAKTWIVVIMGFMVLGNVYALIATRRLRRVGGEPPFFIKIIEYVFEHHPFSSDLHTTVTVCVVVGLAIFSVWSFTRRKTQFS